MKTQFQVLSLVLLSSVHAMGAVVQRVDVVSPPELANTDGPSFVTPAAFSVHYQQLYPSSLFSALPPGGGLLKEVAFRVDAPSGGFWNAQKTGIQVTVSKFTQGSLSPVFSANIGTDGFRLIDSSQNISLNSQWIDAFTPTRFGIAFGVGASEGFHYDPSQGDLLVDVSGLSVPLLLDSYVGTKPIAVWQSTQDFNSPQGRLSSEGLVTLFHFTVPEPGSSAFLALGLGALLLTRASQRKLKEPNVPI